MLDFLEKFSSISPRKTLFLSEKRQLIMEKNNELLKNSVACLNKKNQLKIARV